MPIDPCHFRCSFVFRWSLVEFAQPQYSVCEDVGTVTLTVVRRGSLENSAFVDVQARGRSAKEYEDFVPSKITQIQFDPGEDHEAEGHS